MLKLIKVLLCFLFLVPELTVIMIGTWSEESLVQRRDTNQAYPSSNFYWEVATLVAESWGALIGYLSLD